MADTLSAFCETAATTGIGLFEAPAGLAADSFVASTGPSTRTSLHGVSCWASRLGIAGRIRWLNIDQSVGWLTPSGRFRTNLDRLVLA